MYRLLLLAVLSCVRADNATVADTCDPTGPWSSLLEEWALTPVHNDRQGRIMALPPAPGYYVTDRVDRPPPPPRGPPHNGPLPHPAEAPPLSAGPVPYDEWQGPGKIVNRPSPNKFKPSPQYPPPTPQYPQQQYPPQQYAPQPYPPQQYTQSPVQQIPLQQIPTQHPQKPASKPGGKPGGKPIAVDRIGEAPEKKPQKHVSETDLYLLSAIEKLVWRVDLMEKRLRRMEDSMLHLVGAGEKKPDPCVANFSRVGDICYHFSAEAADWKSANLQCRKLKSNLLEFDTEAERTTLTAAMLADKRIRGTDVWTGGLNPGLLWIWSHSARPLLSNTTTAAAPTGDGRCLALAYDGTNNYTYRGQDCAFRHRFICEKEEDRAKLSNEIERVARLYRGARKGRGLRGEDLRRETDDVD